MGKTLSFDSEVARHISLNAAVVHHYLLTVAFQRFRSGDFNGGWVRASVSDIHKSLDFISTKQIRLALEELERSGIVWSRISNEDPRDRTKSYAALTEYPWDIRFRGGSCSDFQS